MRGFPGVGSSAKPVVNGAIDFPAGDGDDASCCFVIAITLIVLLKFWGGQDLFLIYITVYSCITVWLGTGKITNLFAFKETKPPR